MGYKRNEFWNPLWRTAGLVTLLHFYWVDASVVTLLQQGQTACFVRQCLKEASCWWSALGLCSLIDLSNYCPLKMQRQQLQNMSLKEDGFRKGQPVQSWLLALKGQCVK